MQIKANTIDEYFAALPKERRAALQKIRTTIQANIPPGFEEVMQYHMPSFVVPHSRYPDGYHCKPTDPLPFISIGSQKNFLALYHMGIYANEPLLKWFQEEYPKHSKRKLDMGKSCIRFKYMDHIPYTLIGNLASRMTVDDWITLYEKNTQR